MFGRYRVRLVDDAHQAWKWSSMRILALAGAAEIGLAKCPESVCSHVPEFVMSSLATFVLLAPLLAAAGRLTTVEKSDVRPTDSQPDSN